MINPYVFENFFDVEIGNAASFITQSSDVIGHISGTGGVLDFEIVGNDVRFNMGCATDSQAAKIPVSGFLNMGITSWIDRNNKFSTIDSTGFQGNQFTNGFTSSSQLSLPQVRCFRSSTFDYLDLSNLVSITGNSIFRQTQWVGAKTLDIRNCTTLTTSSLTNWYAMASGITIIANSIFDNGGGTSNNAELEEARINYAATLTFI